MNLLSLGYGSQKKLSELASQSVYNYRLDRETKVSVSKDYLIGTRSPIRSQILDAASLGQLFTIVDFGQLNLLHKLNNCGFLFDDKELDHLIFAVTQYLDQEALDYSITHEKDSKSLIIKWPDPELIQDQTLNIVNTTLTTFVSETDDSEEVDNYKLSL